MASGARQQLAIFIPSMRIGGAERSMAKLAGGLTQRGYAVDLVLAQAQGPHLAEVSESVRVVDLQASRVLASLPALVRYLRREQPAAMLSVMNHANIVALWARRLTRAPTRLVVSERNTLSQGVRYARRWNDRLMPRLIRNFYPWADDIVAVSRGVADDLAVAAGLPRERIRVIYNPIVTPELKQNMQTPVDHPWLQGGQLPVILAIGRLQPQKDFTTLIRAFAKVCRISPARLLILGEGTERPALEALIREMGLEQNVCLPGFVANPLAYLTRASMFVLSSAWEGLPGTLIEALYCGIPLISTDCPSGPREILADGKYGRLVPVGDVNALAQAIEMALAGQIPRPPQESWQRFEQDTVVNQYIDTLWVR